jgi:hypothetical protein
MLRSTGTSVEKQTQWVTIQDPDPDEKLMAGRTELMSNSRGTAFISICRLLPATGQETSDGGVAGASGHGSNMRPKAGDA